MPDIGEHQFVFVKPLCLCAQTMSPIDKIRYIYFVAVCLTLGSPNLYLSKPLCLRAQPMSLNDKIRYIFLCGAVLCLSLVSSLETHQSFVETAVLVCRPVEP